MGRKEDLIIKVRVEVNEAKAKLKNLERTFKDGKTTQKEYAAGQQKLTNKTNKLSHAMGKSTLAFQGWALSTMFAGMALQRLFGSMTKFGVKAFNDVAHSVEGMVTQSDILQGSMKYLGFVIGDALQPVIESLIPIIDAVADWVELNPELAAGIMKWGLILGGMMMAGGMIALAIGGFQQLNQLILGTNSAGLGLKSMLAAGFGFYLSYKGIKDIADGEILRGISSLMKGAGMFAVAGGKTGLGGALFAIGFVMEALDVVIKGGGKFSKESLAKLFISAAPGAFLVNPAVGAALLTIGVVMSLISGKTWSVFYTGLGIIFGAIVAGLAIVIDSLLAPFILIVNAIIMAYNLISGNHIERIRYDNASAPAFARLTDMMNQMSELQSVPRASQDLPTDLGVSSDSGGTTIYIETANISGEESLADAIKQIDIYGGT